MRGLITTPTAAAPHLVAPGVYLSHREYLAYLETCAGRWHGLHAREQGARILAFRASLLTDCGPCRYYAEKEPQP